MNTPLESRTLEFHRLLENYEGTDVGLFKLAEKGIDPNYPPSKVAFKALGLAANRGFTNTCRALVKNGADIHKKDGLGWLPLHAEADQGNVKNCRVFLRHGADINARTDSGKTVLSMALHHDDDRLETRFRRELIKLLIDRGANLYAKTNRSSSFDEVAIFFSKKNIDQTIWTDINAVHVKGWVESCKKSYTDFQRTAKPPNTTTDLCHLLAATPLTDPDGPVDQPTHLRQIFLHAKWGVGQAAKMAEALHKDHLVTASFAEELAAIGEPRRARSLEIGGRAR